MNPFWFGMAFGIAFGIAGGIVGLLVYRFVRAYGKALGITIDPGTGLLGTGWIKTTDFTKVSQDGAPDAACTMLSEYRYSFKNRPAFLIDKSSGLPVKIDDQGRSIRPNGRKIGEILYGVHWQRANAAAGDAQMDRYARMIPILMVLMVVVIAIVGFVAMKIVGVIASGTT